MRIWKMDGGLVGVSILALTGCVVGAVAVWCGAATEKLYSMNGGGG